MCQPGCLVFWIDEKSVAKSPLVQIALSNIVNAGSDIIGGIAALWWPWHPAGLNSVQTREADRQFITKNSRKSSEEECLFTSNSLPV